MKDFPNPGWFIAFMLITAVMVFFSVNAEDPDTGKGGLSMPTQPGLKYKQKRNVNDCLTKYDQTGDSSSCEVP